MASNMHATSSFWSSTVDRHATELSGAASGFATRLITQPFDVLKIRFQLQVEPIRQTHATTTAKYTGLVHACKTIVREEGVLSLWKGHWPAQALSILYGTVQFSIYEKCRKLYTESYAAHHPVGPLDEIVSSHVWLNLACGATAGGIAISVTFPLDLLRTRLVAQGGHVRITSMVQTVRQTYALGGLPAFFSGYSAALLAIMPYTAVTFAAYGLFRHMKLNAGEQPKPADSSTIISAFSRALQPIISGSVAGIAGKTCVYPLDLAKKRMQMHGFEHVRERYGFGASYGDTNRSIMKCLLTAVRNEGVLRGLYKGYVPSCLKAGVSGAASFFFYELAFETFKSMQSEQE